MLLPLEPADRPAVKPFHQSIIDLLGKGPTAATTLVGTDFVSPEGLGALMMTLGTSIIPEGHQQILNAVNERLPLVISDAAGDSEELLRVYGLFVLNINVQATETDQRAKLKAADDQLAAALANERDRETKLRAEELDRRAAELQQLQVKLNERTSELGGSVESLAVREAALIERKNAVQVAEQRIAAHKRRVRNGKKRTRAVGRRKR